MSNWFSALLERITPMTSYLPMAEEIGKAIVEELMSGDSGTAKMIAIAEDLMKGASEFDAAWTANLAADPSPAPAAAADPAPADTLPTDATPAPAGDAPAAEDPTTPA